MRGSFGVANCEDGIWLSSLNLSPYLLRSSNLRWSVVRPINSLLAAVCFAQYEHSIALSSTIATTSRLYSLEVESLNTVHFLRRRSVTCRRDRAAPHDDHVCSKCDLHTANLKSRRRGVIVTTASAVPGSTLMSMHSNIVTVDPMGFRLFIVHRATSSAL